MPCCIAPKVSGSTIAEAMAMGKLVVATDYGGSADFLDAQCGFPGAATGYTRSTTIYGHYTRDGGILGGN